MRMKYIIIEAYVNGPVTHPVIFSELVSHDDMAYRLGKTKVLGAGFAYIDENNKFGCYGKSVSLGVESRGEEDAKFLNKWLLGYDE